MKAIHVTRVAAALVFAFVAQPVYSADTSVPDRGPIPFDSFDADGNGYVNEEEFNRARNDRMQKRQGTQYQYRNRSNAPDFADLDSNGDGRVSREEHQIHQQNRQQIRNQNRINQQQGGGMGMGRGQGMGSGGSGGGKGGGK
jgi:hypothetical protein